MHLLETLHVVNNGQHRGGNLISQYFISIRHEKITWFTGYDQGSIGWSGYSTCGYYFASVACWGEWLELRTSMDI